MMKSFKILSLFLIISSFPTFSQTGMLDAAPEAADLYRAGTDPDLIPGTNNSNSKLSGVMSCAASSTLVTGYPAWANYWAGWMVNIINISTNTITINCFEARFQGTSGYRIYTKAGTFIGFETNSAAWTLVGTANNVTGSAATTTSSPIPIGVNVNINPGATQAFYLTRTDNVIGNRHLYIAGTGTPGTTIYAANADLQVTEANYIDVYFINMGGTRRPSFQIYYSPVSTLPIELSAFKCAATGSGIDLNWTTERESGSDYFIIERSKDAGAFEAIGKVSASGTTQHSVNYKFTDNAPMRGVNYYRLRQVDKNGAEQTFDISSCDHEVREKKMNVYSIMGRFVMSTTTIDAKQTLDQLDLNSGLYLVELESGEDLEHFKYFKH
jgi:hypothetical protein